MAEQADTMDIPGLSPYEQALKFRAARNEVLSSNIANADTPNYKARDIDFSSALQSARGETLNMATSSHLHRRAGASDSSGLQTMYRMPHQPSLDGNTVEMDVEQAAFAENALQYRASLAFLDGQIRSLRYALKGGE